MQNWKSKYLQMKLKYINAKNLVGGSNLNNSMISFTGNFFTYRNLRGNLGMFTFQEFGDAVERDFLNLKSGFESSNSQNVTVFEESYQRVFRDLKAYLIEENKSDLFGIVDDLIKSPNIVYNMIEDSNKLTHILDLYGARLESSVLLL